MTGLGLFVDVVVSILGVILGCSVIEGLTKILNGDDNDSRK